MIGVDFDNTIAGYDELMHAIAVERGLIAADSPRNKKMIRDAIRLRPDGETQWRGVQVEAYGPRMSEARLIDGVRDFFLECRRRDVPVFIVSHKTEFANFGDTSINLRRPALAWLEQQGFFAEDSIGMDPGHVFFETTRAEKVARVATIGATHFIDDLEETFLEATFPARVTRLLLDAVSNGAHPADHRFARWDEIHDHVFGPVPDPRAALARLLDRDVAAVERIGRGGNSKVYRVDCGDGTRQVAKFYFQRTMDGLDRLDVEFSALEFLWVHGERRIPRPFVAGRAESIAVYEYVDASPVEPSTVTTQELQQVVAFAGSLRHIAHRSSPPYPRRAAEACFSFAELEENIGRRIERLVAARSTDASYGEFDDFIDGELLPAAGEIIGQAKARVGQTQWTAELAAEYRTLSPSDFGFHNALRRADATLVFLDFEYFGIDDPAKMIADFVLHPAMALPEAHKREFVALMLAEFAGDAGLAARLEAAYPLYALKWCTILLNEFVPKFLARRHFAVAGGVDARETRATQLGKARRYLRRIIDDAGHFPFRNVRA